MASQEAFQDFALPLPTGRSPAMNGGDEARIRRAIRQIINWSRSPDGHADVQYVFDLLGYLSPAAQAIVEDEVASVLAELVGSV